MALRFMVLINYNQHPIWRWL